MLVSDALDIARVAASCLAVAGIYYLFKLHPQNRAAQMVPTVALGVAVLVNTSTFVADLAPSRVSPNQSSSASTATTSEPSAIGQRLDFIQREVRGSIAVSAPSKAVQYEPFQALLRVSPQKLAGLMARLKSDAPENPTVVGKEDVWLLPVMEAGAYGSGFQFEPAGKQAYAQAVAATEPTTWFWQIMPTESGTQTLTFRLSGTLSVGAKEREVARELYDQTLTVAVEVNPQGFFKRNWKDLLAMAGGFIAAIATAGWAFWKWHRPTATPSASPASPPAPTSSKPTGATAPAVHKGKKR